MKNTKRLLLGLLSSVLLSTGFGQTADHLDPITNVLGGATDVPVLATEPTNLCDFADS